MAIPTVRTSGYRDGVTSTASHPDELTGPPPADPKAIRACLTPRVAAEFDTEWNIVLDRAKQAMDLAPIHKLLNKWRHLAYAELKDPGSYFRLVATAEHTLATGQAPAGSVSGEDIMARIHRRLGR